MRRIAGFIFVLFLFTQLPAPALHGQVIVPPVHTQSVVPPAVTDDENNIETEAYRSGRGSYRSPAGTYTGGNRAGVNPGYGTGGTVRRPGINEPAGRTPAAPGSRFGGFFGGLFAGTFLGSLLNPFGFGGVGGGGFSLLGLLFWAAIIFVAYRVIRRLMHRGK